MVGKQRLVRRRQVIEAPFLVVGQFMVVAQQEEPAAFQGPSSFAIEMALLLATQGVNLAVDQGHDSDSGQRRREHPGDVP